MKNEVRIQPEIWDIQDRAPVLDPGYVNAQGPLLVNYGGQPTPWKAIHHARYHRAVLTRMAIEDMCRNAHARRP